MMTIVTLVLSSIIRAGWPETCIDSHVATPDLAGTWEGHHYLNDHYFSLELSAKGDGNLMSVFGPPHVASFRRLQVNSLTVKSGRLKVAAVNGQEKITIEGCVSVSRSGNVGMIDYATVSITNLRGEFPTTMNVVFTRGRYLERRNAFKRIADSARQSGQDTNIVPTKPDPPLDWLWELPVEGVAPKGGGSTKQRSNHPEP